MDVCEEGEEGEEGEDFFYGKKWRARRRAHCIASLRIALQSIAPLCNASLRSGNLARRRTARKWEFSAHVGEASSGG